MTLSKIIAAADSMIQFTVAYAFCLGSMFFGLTCYHFRSDLNRLKNIVRIPVLKHLSYRPFVRSRPLMHWTRGHVLMELLYVGLNVFCLSFKSQSMSTACRRAANLALVNMIFLYATPHLDSFASVLGLRWRSTRRLHGSIGVMTGLLIGIHVLSIRVASVSFPLKSRGNTWALIAASLLALLLMLSTPPLKRWFELFLRLHQALAILSVYGLWLHLASKPLEPRVYLYILIGVCGLSVLLLASVMFWRTGILSRGFPRATITSKGGAVLVNVELSRPIVTKPGQHISLRLFAPSTTFKSYFQSHPFVVASWSDRPQTSLNLLIQPRQGLTQHLLARSRVRQDSCRALFSGPHGATVPVGKYETVVMAAAGYGIAAQLPYLKYLIHAYNSRKVRTRRIHLVWEVKTLELPIAIQHLLNNALDDDTLDHGYILQISVYVEHLKIEDRLKARAKVIKGLPDWYSIIRDEASGRCIKRVQDEIETREDMIVTVSASSGVTCELRDIVQTYVGDRVEMVELDYQPDD